MNLNNQTESTMSHDYQDTHIKTCEKLIRQRIYYISLAKKWEAEALHPATSPTDEDVLRAKVELAMRIASDLKFITDRATRNLPVSDLERIQDMTRRPLALQTA